MSLLDNLGICRVKAIDGENRLVLLTENNLFGENFMRMLYTLRGYNVYTDKKSYDDSIPGLEEGTVEGALEVARGLAEWLPKDLRVLPTN